MPIVGSAFSMCSAAPLEPITARKINNLVRFVGAGYRLTKGEVEVEKKSEMPISFADAVRESEQAWSNPAFTRFELPTWFGSVNVGFGGC